MNCSRCGGCLAIEPSIDFYNPEGQWRCINCGAQTSSRASASAKFETKWPRVILTASVEKMQTPHRA